MSTPKKPGTITNFKDLKTGLKPKASTGSFFVDLENDTLEIPTEQVPTTFRLDADLQVVIAKLLKEKKTLKKNALLNECIRFALTEHDYIKKEKAEEEVK